MTSGKRYLRFPTPTPLLIFDRRPPPWYKFLSLPSVLLPLKSRVVPKFSSRKCRALARQNYVYSGYKSNTENVTVCIRILTTSLRNKKYSQFLNKKYPTLLSQCIVLWIIVARNFQTVESCRLAYRRTFQNISSSHVFIM